MTEITPLKVNDEIAELLENPLSYTTAERLVTLFKLKKYLCEFWEDRKDYGKIGKTVADDSASAFVKAASLCPAAEFIEIMDEHMEWLFEAHPRMHMALMEQIKKAGESR